MRQILIRGANTEGEIRSSQKPRGCGKPGAEYDEPITRLWDSLYLFFTKNEDFFTKILSQ